MNLEQFLSAQFSFQGSTLLLFFVGVSIILFGLVAYALNLRSKLEQAEAPKYGFLGKPLLQFIMFALLFSGVVGSVYVATSPSSGIVNVSGKQELDVQFTSKVLQKGQNYEVEFDVIPLLNGRKWGNDVRNQFDVFINFGGPANYNEFFYSKNSDQGIKFRKVMVPGIYKITFTVVKGSSTEQIVQTVDLTKL